MPKDLNINIYQLILNGLLLRHYDIDLTRHTFIRASQRHIDLDKVYATVRGGKIKRIGKHNIKFIKRYKRFELICVGQITCMGIRIFTVEIKK